MRTGRHVHPVARNVSRLHRPVACGALDGGAGGVVARYGRSWKPCRLPETRLNARGRTCEGVAKPYETTLHRFLRLADGWWETTAALRVG